MISPAIVLSVIVGLFHVAAYVFIRGRAGARLPLLVFAAILGAWAGDALGDRLDLDPLRVGDFHVLLASTVAWLGIGLVAILAILVPERQPRIPMPVTSSVRRSPSRLVGGRGAAPADDGGSSALAGLDSEQRVQP